MHVHVYIHVDVRMRLVVQTRVVHKNTFGAVTLSLIVYPDEFCFEVFPAFVFEVSVMTSAFMFVTHCHAYKNIDTQHLLCSVSYPGTLNNELGELFLVGGRGKVDGEGDGVHGVLP